MLKKEGWKTSWLSYRSPSPVVEFFLCFKFGFCDGMLEIANFKQKKQNEKVFFTKHLKQKKWLT
jgi:hypothetical protein